MKFDILNENQYFIGGEDSVKIFDIRTNLEIESISEFSEALDIFNDSKSYLIVKEQGLSLYTNKNKKLKEWNEFGQISHMNMNIVNFQNPEVFLVGTVNGDVFISDKEDKFNN